MIHLNPANCRRIFPNPMHLSFADAHAAWEPMTGDRIGWRTHSPLSNGWHAVIISDPQGSALAAESSSGEFFTIAAHIGASDSSDVRLHAILYAIQHPKHPTALPSGTSNRPC